MQKDLIERFIGKQVKLVYGINHFALYGSIDTISDDFLLFTTNREQKTSMINICDIKEIVPL